MNKEEKKIGRPGRFEKGFKLEHQYTAMLLALGKSYKQASKISEIPLWTIKDWARENEYNQLVEQWRQKFVKNFESKGFDGMKFLRDTQIESMLAKPTRADGLRAREIEAKILGELSPEKREIKIKEDLKKMPSSDLDKLLKRMPVVDESNTQTSNIGGIREKEE